MTVKTAIPLKETLVFFFMIYLWRGNFVYKIDSHWEKFLFEMIYTQILYISSPGLLVNSKYHNIIITIWDRVSNLMCLGNTHWANGKEAG